MSKRLFFFFVVLICFKQSFAGHIAGGEMYYVYNGAGTAANTSRYTITLRLFRECNPVAGQPTAQLPTTVEIGIFDNSNRSSTPLNDFMVPSDNGVRELTLQAPLPCIINKPVVCYQISTYTRVVDLPINADGYTIAYQTCCRSNSVINVQKQEINVGQPAGEGSTYSATIPGTNLVGAAGINSSAIFSLKDTVLICSKKKINIDFSATDGDNDSLSYSFCDAYNRGNSENSANVVPSAPPYRNVTYTSGFSGQQPLGSTVVIDAKTGVISGTAPSEGAYVVNVCVFEWRKGEVIAIHRKDFLVRVSNCDYAAAELDPSYTSCDGFTVNFANESQTATNIHTYYWEFGSNGQSSNQPTPSFTYADTGVYKARLVINRGEECSDSTETLVKVYPGFIPQFDIVGGCFQNPYKFVDKTSTEYGIVDTWKWNFGDVATTADTSLLQNPQYKYNSVAVRNVKLVVTNSKGCVDSLITELNVTDRPAITLPFRDTLICNLDSLRLHSSTTIPVSYAWTPSTRAIQFNTANPLVYPNQTTKYYISVDDGAGCKNTDSLTVNVVDKTTLELGKDTSICLTDTIHFKPQTNALYFAWSPVQTINDATIKEPYAVPTQATTYSLHAFISKKCFADDEILVRTPPYPISDAGVATPICYGFTTQLNAFFTGTHFSWSPANSLLNAGTLTPTAGPQTTQVYTLTVTNTNADGCPKAVTDTVTVVVIPPLNVFAGNDTNIVINQPLQLLATGAVNYTWTPTTGINNPSIADPIITLGEGYTVMRYNVKGTTPQGCFDNDSITVYVYKTLPEIFVPSGFTPNGDGKNDILRPIMAGIKKLEIFSVYNRWGQMLYSTSVNGEGWDGMIGGKKQPAGTYVYMAQAIDFGGRPIQRKGSFVLIR